MFVHSTRNWLLLESTRSQTNTKLKRNILPIPTYIWVTIIMIIEFHFARRLCSVKRTSGGRPDHTESSQSGEAFRECARSFVRIPTWRCSSVTKQCLWHNAYLFSIIDLCPSDCSLCSHNPEHSSNTVSSSANGGCSISYAFRTSPPNSMFEWISLYWIHLKMDGANWNIAQSQQQTVNLEMFHTDAVVGFSEPPCLQFKDTILFAYNTCARGRVRYRAILSEPTALWIRSLGDPNVKPFSGYLLSLSP